jgi:hypothetical protein
MIIGTKYWAEGASAPASFTDTDVLTCHPREVVREYDSKVALDGTNLSWLQSGVRGTRPSFLLLPGWSMPAWVASAIRSA